MCSMAAVVYVYIYIQFIYDLFGNEIRAIGINNKIGRKSNDGRSGKFCCLLLLLKYTQKKIVQRVND